MKTSLKPVILSLMIIGFLIFPVVALDYVDDLYIEYVTDYSNIDYEPIEIDYVNKTDFEDNAIPHALHQIDEANNSNLIGLYYHGLGLTDIQYSNNITYIGNNTYYVDFSNFTYRNKIIIPLNLTTHNLTNYDTVLVLCEAESILGYYDGVNPYLNDIDSYEIVEEQWFNIIDLDSEIDLLTVPDYQVFVQLQNPSLDKVNISVQGGEIKSQGLFNVPAETYYYSVLVADIIIGIVILIFMTDIIDIKIDKRGKK